jgi:signal transduction histidine kinase
MQLADFILHDMERILAQWESFAATRLPAAGHMAPLELRDHAQQILEAIVADLRTSQTAEAQAAKSMGLAPTPIPATETAAQVHALLRAKEGFDIKQLASEYRALRASVLALWMDAYPPVQTGLLDVIRFNEAIDQALAESISVFHAEVQQARNLLLGVLTHDMRNPLQAIQMTAAYLAKINAGNEVSVAARRLIGSGGRLQALLNDMVDFSRSNLGLGIGIVPSAVDVGTLCAETIDEIRGSYPDARVELSVVGECDGHWDGQRVQQLIANLIVNAIHYGKREEAIRIAVTGEETDVCIEVANRGPPMDPGTLLQMFEPLKRGIVDADQPGLGLGLYIVREVARAHGGTAEARSDAKNTVFSVRLPRVDPKKKLPRKGVADPTVSWIQAQPRAEPQNAPFVSF